MALTVKRVAEALSERKARAHSETAWGFLSFMNGERASELVAPLPTEPQSPSARPG